MLAIRREFTWATGSKFRPVGFYGDSSKRLKISTQQPEVSQGWTQWRGKVALERRRGSISSSTATSALGSPKRGCLRSAGFGDTFRRIPSVCVIYGE